jgi:hypothetical protein
VSTKTHTTYMVWTSLLLCFVAAGLVNAQFMDQYAHQVAIGDRECACDARAPCQHIATTIMNDLMGSGAITCVTDMDCPLWNAQTVNSLDGKRFFMCCRGGDNPLLSCDLPVASVLFTTTKTTATTTPATTTTTAQTTTHKTTHATTDLVQFTEKTTQVTTKVTSSVSTPLLTSTTYVLTTTNQTGTNRTTQIENGTLVRTPQGSSQGSVHHDRTCDVFCIAGASGGGALLLVIVLVLGLYYRGRKSRRGLPAAELKDLREMHKFPGAPPVVELYAELSDMSGAEYAYEEPVSLYDMADPHPADGKVLAFHNPTYNGPPIEVQEPIYDTVDETQSKVIVNDMYNAEEDA